MTSSFNLRRTGTCFAKSAAALALAAGFALAFVMCFVAATPETASAVSVEISPYAGYVWWDSDLQLKDTAHYGGKLGLYFGLLGIEGNFGYSSVKTEGPLEEKAALMNYGGDLVLRFAKDGSVIPYILGGVGQVSFDPDAEDVETKTETSYDAGAGLLFKLGPMVGLRFEARDLMHKVTPDIEDPTINDDLRHNIVATGGLSLIFGGQKDTDKDGVKDNKDQCPDTPLGAIVDEAGCPIDTDKDGVPDGIDQCADTPKGCTVDARGCPSDSDKDGLCDGLDQCPDTPAGAPVDEKGCPKDSDGDGVPDYLDQCPNTPAGMGVDEKGCPKDTDGDGVSDDKDLCPNTQPGVKVDKDGCPIEITEQEKELLDKGLITIRTIKFETAKSNILPESEPVLSDLGKILIQWPQLQIEIGGHADSRGKDAYNQTLSEARANSVRDWLLAHYPQLNAASLTAVGFGESKPVATNKTQTGMALNRRVEFKVLNTEELMKIKERRRTLQQGE